MTAVQERLGHESGGVGEVDEPRTGSAAPCGLLGQLEHDGNGPEGLRESARARGLLADAAEPARGSSRPSAGTVWPPTRSWTITKSAPSSASSPTIGEDEPAGPPDAAEHALGQRSDDLEPRSGRCPAGRARPRGADRRGVTNPSTSSGRVGASPADDRHLHTHGTASYTAAVKSLGNFPDPFFAEIAGQPDGPPAGRGRPPRPAGDARGRWRASHETAPCPHGDGRLVRRLLSARRRPRRGGAHGRDARLRRAPALPTRAMLGRRPR